MNALDKLLNSGSVQTVVDDSIYHAAIREVKRLREIEAMWNSAQQSVHVDEKPCPLDHKELSQTGVDVCPECREVTAFRQ